MNSFIGTLALALAVAPAAFGAVSTNSKVICNLNGPGVSTWGEVASERKIISGGYGQVFGEGYIYYPQSFDIPDDEIVGAQAPFHINARTPAAPGIRVSVYSSEPVTYDAGGYQQQATFFSMKKTGPWESVLVSFFPSKEVNQNFRTACTAAEGLNCAFNRALYGQESVSFSTEDVRDGKAQKKTKVAIVGSNHDLQFVEAQVSCRFK